MIFSWFQILSTRLKIVFFISSMKNRQKNNFVWHRTDILHIHNLSTGGFLFLVSCFVFRVSCSGLSQRITIDYPPPAMKIVTFRLVGLSYVNRHSALIPYEEK